MITRNDKHEATLKAEKRFYTTSGMIMTEAAIDAGITRNLYAALGEELDDGSWAVSCACSIRVIACAAPFGRVNHEP